MVNMDRHIKDIFLTFSFFKMITDSNENMTAKHCWVYNITRFKMHGSNSRKQGLAELQ